MKCTHTVHKYSTHTAHILKAYIFETILGIRIPNAHFASCICIRHADFAFAFYIPYPHLANSAFHRRIPDSACCIRISHSRSAFGIRIPHPHFAVLACHIHISYTYSVFRMRIPRSAFYIRIPRANSAFHLIGYV